MVVSVRWFNEDNDIIWVQYRGRWTWDEVREADAVFRAMLATVSHRVDSVIDMRDNRWYPPGFVENVRALSQKPYPHIGVGVLVGPDLSHGVIATYMEQYGPLPYRLLYAHTIPQALDLIEADRRDSAPD